MNRIFAENSTNLEFSTCDTRPPQKKSYDVVNGLALLLTSDDLGRSKGDIGMATVVLDLDLIHWIFS